MIQYKIAAGLLALGIVLWGLTMLFYKPEGGRFRDVEHLGD